MKKITFFSLSLLFILFFTLSACSSGQATDTVTTDTNTTNSIPPAGDTPTNMQLALGTFVLEDTAYAITAEQAATLLPLWKAAKALASSETITAEEYQAIYTQIEDALTAEQMSAIQTADLTPEGMASITQKYGLTFGGGGNGFDPANLSPEQQATREAFQQSRQNGSTSGGGFPGGAPPDGGFIGGGPGGGPGGGGFGGDGVTFSPEARQTAVASGTGGGRQFGGNGGLPSSFYDAIITFLEGKVQQ